ncbi:MAG: VanZ family protein [Gammaproteobacteria bacterium]|nr:VanZ family protein [Gammaproteobacteria bacterium]
MVAPIKDSFSEQHFIEVSWNSGHVLYFFLFSYVLYKLIPSLNTLSMSRQYLYIGVVCLVIGACIELVQLFTHRSASLNDLVYNLAGGMAAVTFLSPGLTGLKHRKNILIYIPVFMLLAYGLWGPIGFVINSYLVNKNFPVINAFESSLEKQRWHGQATFDISTEKSSEGEFSFKIEFARGHYSSAKLRQMYADWVGYRKLLFDIYNNEDKSVQLIVSVYDSSDTNTKTNYANRFNRKLELQPGWNSINIELSEIKNGPKNRQLLMQDIAGMMFYAMRIKSPFTLYLDNIRLGD